MGIIGSILRLFGFGFLGDVADTVGDVADTVDDVKDNAADYAEDKAANYAKKKVKGVVNKKISSSRRNKRKKLDKTDKYWFLNDND